MIVLIIKTIIYYGPIAEAFLIGANTLSHYVG